MHIDPLLQDTLLAPYPPRLTMTVIEITWRVEEPVKLPGFLGSTLRGVVGRALRPLVCITGAEECAGCVHQPHCAFGYLWSGESPPGAPTRLSTPQRPYLFETPNAPGPLHFRANEALTCRIRLFGSGRAFLPTLVLALREAGGRGLGEERARATLDRIDRLDPNGLREAIYRQSRGYIHAPPAPPWIVTPEHVSHSGDVTLHLDTPLAIKSGRQILHNLDLEAFTARLSERLDAMCAAYEDYRPQWSFDVLRQIAREVEIVEADLQPANLQRKSDHQGRRIQMEGLLGHATLRNVHPDLLALWRCAEDVHVGKSAVFGFGQVRFTQQ